MKTITTLPFLLAFMVAVVAMPTDVYQICAWNVGTLKIEPWRVRSARALHGVATGILAWFRQLLTPRLGFAVAAVALALLVSTLSASAADGVMLAAIPGLAGMKLEELRQRKGELAQQADQVLNDAATRTWTSEDETKFNAIHADIEDINKHIERREKMDAINASLSDSQGRRSAAAAPASEPNRQTQTTSNRRTAASAADQARAMLAFFMAGSDDVNAEYLAAARRCGINPEGKKIYLGLAARPPASRRAQDMETWERDYLGVDIVSPDTGSHYLVPNETMRALEVALLEFGGMRAVASVLRTDTGANLPIPTMNDTSNEGAIIGESVEETNEVLPDIGQLVLEAYTYSSRKIPVSIEFMQDNAINFASRVGELLGQRIARISNRHFTVGTGNSQPKGIVTAATDSGVTSASATGFSYDNIVDLTHSVDPAYRNNGGRFMFHDNSLKALKKIKIPQYSGDTAGQPLWRPGLTAGVPDTIDGYPYTINQHMPLPTHGLKAMIFGALSKYQIRDVRLVEVMRLNELRAEFRQVLWLAFSRHDGDLLDAGTHPVKYLTMA